MPSVFGFSVFSRPTIIVALGLTTLSAIVALIRSVVWVKWKIELSESLPSVVFADVDVRVGLRKVAVKQVLEIPTK